MTMKVVSITKGKTVEEANDIILSKGIRALPVVEDNKIIGIISETDILHYFNEKYSESK
jgi:acetoin utilization protein AcuB